MKTIDMESLKVLADMLKPAPIAPIAPVAPVKDSFAIFGNDLAKYWFVIAAVIGAFLWTYSGINSNAQANKINTDNIASLAATVKLLSDGVQAHETTDLQTNNDIINKLNLLQQDITIIKGK